MSFASRTVPVLRTVARAVLVGLVLFWGGFAVLSGVESDQGIGVMFRNLPNVLPWLALLACVYIAFRWEGVGGILIVLMGLVSIGFFNALASPLVFFLVSLPLLVLGGALVICSFLSRRAP